MSKQTVQMFNLPNLFTAGNLLSGVLAILLALAGRLEYACYLIYLAAVLDFFDGFLARKLKVSSELGKQLDSLADMVTFGVAPGILVFVILILQLDGGCNPMIGQHFELCAQERISSYLQAFGAGKASWLPLSALVIPFFSLFRLAKFNIDTRQSESFIGLPTPAHTIFYTAFPFLLVQSYNAGQTDSMVQVFVGSHWFILLVVLMSILLVAELPLFALKFKDFTWKNNQIRFVFLGMAAVLIPLLFAWSIPIIIILYLLLSLIENYRKKNAA